MAATESGRGPGAASSSRGPRRAVRRDALSRVYCVAWTFCTMSFSFGSVMNLS